MRDGASNLTLDAVAAEAGISKGSVLYDCKSKHALIQGDYRAQDCQRRQENRRRRCRAERAEECRDSRAYCRLPHTGWKKKPSRSRCSCVRRLPKTKICNA
ncbi:TetR/AcrR family transcriptional regulator [Devosia sp. A8/3-2]|nr:TetR/AcrR family transcriptional regulator [Devosia sp. A8/3-2]